MRRRAILRRLCCEFAIRETLAGWRVDHTAHFRAEFIGRTAAACGSRFHQHFANRSTGNAHAVDARHAHRGRPAGHLHIHVLRDGAEGIARGALEKVRDGIGAHVPYIENESLGEWAVGKQRVSRRSFRAHFAPIGVQFLCGHLAERRISPRAHVAMRNHHGNRSVIGDLDPTGNKALTGFRVQKIGASEPPAGPKAITDNQGTGSGGGADQEFSARDHEAPPRLLEAKEPEAKERTAARMRGYVPQRQMLVIASASCSSLGAEWLAKNALTAMIMPDWQ